MMPSPVDRGSEAGELAGTWLGAGSPGRWWTLCPLGAWSDPVLEAIRGRLDDPSLRAALGEDAAAHRYPRRAMDALRDAGLTQLFTDPRLRTVYHHCALGAMAARVSGGLAISLGVNFLAFLPIQLAGSSRQQERACRLFGEGEVAALLLTEWAHGSDLARTETVATEGTDGFVISGEKHLINGGREAKILVTLARTGDPPRDPSPFTAAAPLSLFFLERDETVEVGESFRTLPAPAADISTVRFRDTPASPDALLGASGEGFSILQRTLAISRGGIASLASGAATGAWDVASAYARERRIYGRPLHELGAIVDHLMRLAALDLLAAATAVKAAAAVNALGAEAGYFTAVAKLAGCDLAEEAVDEGRRILGARALVHELPYAQMVRDVLLYGVFDGTRHVMLGWIQQALTRMAARDDERDTVAGIRDIYRRVPRPLGEVADHRARPWLPSLPRHCRALQDLPGEQDLEPVRELGTATMEMVRELGAGGRWGSDQGLAFDVAETAARIEAMIALAELGDPDRRAALGARPASFDEPGGPELVRFALGWMGARCAARLRCLALRTEVSTAADLEGAQAASAAAMEVARSSLRASLSGTGVEPGP